MQSLFNLASSVTQGVVGLPADWLYIKLGLHRNLSSVVNFYRKNPMAVHSNHFLVKLLQSITVPQSQNLDRYYDNVDSLSLNLSMALKMTSSIYKGALFNGTFYGDDNTEFLIAINDSFDIYKAHDNWENIVAVKVLRCPRSDLGFNLPNGINTGSESGLAVISINIPLLAIQYRAFRLNEINIAEGSDGTGDSQKSLMQFIHMYVLPNMLFSQLDQVIFNRIANLFNGAPIGESSRKHSFYLPDYTDKMNSVHNTLIKNLVKVGKDFSGTLRTIPMAIKENADELMVMPEIPLTIQAIPAIFLARLNVLTFLFGISPIEKNKMAINQVLRTIKIYNVVQLCKRVLPIDIYVDVLDEVLVLEESK
jgi:hypothetical protein